MEHLTKEELLVEIYKHKPASIHDVIPSEYLFRAFNEMPKIEQLALQRNFNTFLSHRSSQIIFDRLLQRIRLIPVPEDLVGEPLAVRAHLALMCRVPSQSLLTILQVSKRAIRGGWRNFLARFGRP